MNVINKWQKTGITFKNEVFECYYNAETYPDHPNHFDKRKCDGGGRDRPGLNRRKTGSVHAAIQCPCICVHAGQSTAHEDT